MEKRIRWMISRDSEGAEYEAGKEVLLALVRSPTGMAPVQSPASNGIQPDGSLRFTDWRGQIVTAQVGDEIALTSQGWVLHPEPRP